MVQKFSRSTAFVFLSAVGFLLSSPSAAEDVSKNGELLIKVQFPDGSPAAGVPVHVAGLERNAIFSRELGVTDSEGKLRGEFRRGQEDPAASALGYGVYRFIVMPEGFRWELSDLYCWNEYPTNVPDSQQSMGQGGFSGYEAWFEAGYDGQLSETNPANNWSYGKGVPVRFGALHLWTVTLQRGESTMVRLEDVAGTPIADEEVTVGIDLRARSRTGYGAQFPVSKKRTDEKGLLSLDHVGDYAYQIDAGGLSFYAPDYWCWTPHVDHNLLKQGPIVQFRRESIPDLQFLVQTKDGHIPVSGATITPVCQFPGVVQSIYPVATTDSDGKAQCEKPFALEHCIRFEAIAEGYEPARVSMKDHAAGTPVVFELVPESAR